MSNFAFKIVSRLPSSLNKNKNNFTRKFDRRILNLFKSCAKNMTDSGFNFKLPKLESLNLNSENSSISLSALANNHLGIDSNGGSGFALPTLTSLGTNNSKSSLEGEGPTSLQALANLHLDQSSATQTGFSIPSIFGQDSSEVTQILLPIPTSPEKIDSKPIDLLKIQSEKPLKPQKPIKVIAEKVIKKNLEVELLLEETNFEGKENCKIQSQGSILGKVLTRKWRKKRRIIPYPTNIQSDVKPFMFDTKSPDDIVRDAQSQVFSRIK